jgi:hypothetical protein
MSVADLVAQVRSELAAHVDPEYRQGAVNFFRESVDLWGVRVPHVKQIARQPRRVCHRALK